LATVLGVLKHFQGGVAAARRDWLKAHPEEIVGFIRGNLAALQWLYEPANKGRYEEAPKVYGWAQEGCGALREPFATRNLRVAFGQTASG